jgi:hypothetical protein
MTKLSRKDLKEFGKMVAIQKHFLETDEHYRKRLVEYLRSTGKKSTPLGCKK